MTSAQAPAGTVQYATFLLDGLYFGIEVLNVQEVIRHQDIIPHQPRPGLVLPDIVS